jgi:hypothetical protein
MDVICGCPVLEFIDFTLTGIQVDKPPPRQEVFLPENMVAICPSHNQKLQAGKIDTTLLRSSRNTPFSKIHDDLAFRTISSKNSLYLWEDALSLTLQGYWL